jgi:hypothetical protein
MIAKMQEERFIWPKGKAEFSSPTPEKTAENRVPPRPERAPVYVTAEGFPHAGLMQDAAGLS